MSHKWKNDYNNDQNLKKLEIIYNNILIKQQSRVTYLDCILEETMSGESMTNKVMTNKAKLMRD